MGVVAGRDEESGGGLGAGTVERDEGGRGRVGELAEEASRSAISSLR